jgi:hypothetical protein
MRSLFQRFVAVSIFLGGVRFGAGLACGDTVTVTVTRSLPYHK